MKNSIKKVFSLAGATILSVSLMTGGFSASAAESNGLWVTGDFNVRTVLSDGEDTAAQAAAKAKTNGLDWIAAADIGGGTVGAKDGTGTNWSQAAIDAATGTSGTLTAMPRWASINGAGEDEINKNRSSITQISGFGWNVPAHGSAAVGLVGNSADVKKSLAIFDYIYDGQNEETATVDWLKDLKRDLDDKGAASTKRTNNTHMGAIDAITYAGNQFGSNAYILPLSPSKNLGYTAATLKEMYDEAPEVFFGAEMIPGQQNSAWRGGYSSMIIFDSVIKKNVDISGKTGATPEAKLDAYISAQIATDTDGSKGYATSYPAAKAAMMVNLAQQRTYGGADYMLAKVGGTWDTMLSEGRKFWMFGNSGYSSATDFVPGEYVKNHTYAQSKNAADVLAGMRSGNSFTAMGNLINALDYKISNNTATATMGQTLRTIKGKSTTVTIRFKAPSGTPAVDHIDLIAGEVKGEPDVKYDSKTKDFENPLDYLTAEYRNDDVSATTKVIKTFNKSDFTTDSDGWMTVTFTLPASDKDMYYRLRGTNNAKGTENVDANGNPTVDTALTAVAGDNTAAKANADLWFYSNPVFVNAQADGVTVQGTLKDADGKPYAGKTVEIDEIITTTDANGKFTFDNMTMDIHTIIVKDGGTKLGELTFNLQRGEKTEFDAGDIWIAEGAYEIDLTFMLGSALSISGVSDRLAHNDGTTTTQNENTSPATGDSSSFAGMAFLAALSAIAILITVKMRKREYVK